MLSKTMGCVRAFWNMQVAVFNSYDKETNPSPIYKNTTEVRKEFLWMQEVSYKAIQQKENDFKEFKKQHFSKTRKKQIGRPKFKKKGVRDSFRLSNDKFYIKYGSIRLSKIGFVKFVQDRPLPENSKLMSVTVSKDSTGAYYASILVETVIEQLPKTNKSVGVDVGIKEFATLSDGQVIANPKYFRESQAKLRKAQKSLSRKKKGSSRRNKAKLKVARLHKKVANQRYFFLHNVSTNIVRQFDTICIEDLNVAGMVKNRKLAKSISDASFSKFFDMLQYKALWYGKEVVKVGRFYPSSKTCSDCGAVKKQLNLSERTYCCENCGLVIDRDLNAALNIKALGVNSAIRA